jgi:hypothetical protein
MIPSSHIQLCIVPSRLCVASWIRLSPVRPRHFAKVHTAQLRAYNIVYKPYHEAVVIPVVPGRISAGSNDGAHGTVLTQDGTGSGNDGAGNDESGNDGTNGSHDLAKDGSCSRRNDDVTVARTDLTLPFW